MAHGLISFSTCSGWTGEAGGAADRRAHRQPGAGQAGDGADQAGHCVNSEERRYELSSLLVNFFDSTLHWFEFFMIVHKLRTVKRAKDILFYLSHQVNQQLFSLVCPEISISLLSLEEKLFFRFFSRQKEEMQLIYKSDVPILFWLIHFLLGRNKGRVLKRTS